MFFMEYGIYGFYDSRPLPPFAGGKTEERIVIESDPVKRRDSLSEWVLHANHANTDRGTVHIGEQGLFCSISHDKTGGRCAYCPINRAVTRF